MVLNLLDNAIKYTRANDQVVVRLAHVASGVQVTVADSGPGIPPEHLPHLTRRFYRATAVAPGSGLGLAVAAEILLRHGSRLVIESMHGTQGSNDRATGTTVSFILPAVAYQTERGS